MANGCLTGGSDFNKLYAHSLNQMEGAVAHIEDAARVFKILSVETRVRMIDLLRRRSLCVNAMARALNISPAAVSQHLRILRDADVVIAEKREYFVHYRINEQTLEQWRVTADQMLSPGPKGFRLS
jgi:ArsR family transcriptional regulator, arsenate/arsenite/antimonite-responsive transcriptional repressor